MTRDEWAKTGALAQPTYRVEPHLDGNEQRDGWLILALVDGREPEPVDVWPTRAAARRWVARQK